MVMMVVMAMIIIVVIVFMVVIMILIIMAVAMSVGMAMSVMLVPVVVILSVPAVVFVQVHIEFCAFDARASIAPDMQVVFLQAEPAKFMLELFKIQAEVNHCPEKHVPADATENIQVKCLHVPIDYPSNCTKRLSLMR